MNNHNHPETPDPEFVEYGDFDIDDIDEFDAGCPVVKGMACAIICAWMVALAAVIAAMVLQ